jgi:2-methylcitrate dehydratase PrpD
VIRSGERESRDETILCDSERRESRDETIKRGMCERQSMTGGLDEFAAWAASFDIDDAPGDVVHRAGLQVASAFAGARAGAGVDWLDATATAGRPSGTDAGGQATGTATVVGGGRADPYTAAFTNAAASTVHDYDDYLFMGHTGHSAVFASLAACERAGVDGATLLENVVVANELEGRLGAAVAVGPHNGQMWAFIHQAGAAAVAANVGGDADDIREAVGMALYNPDDPLEAGFIDGDSKAFTAAKPTAAGLRVGDAAVGGATASPAALSDFLDSYAYLPFPEMLDGYGKSWVTRTLCYKPRPGCGYVQSPLACLEALTDRGLDPGEIDAIRVRASLPTVAMEGLSRPYRNGRLTPVNVTFSVPYTLAVHLVAGEVTPERLTEEYIESHREQLDAMADRVTLEHDWSLTADLLSGLGAGVDYGPLIRDRGLVATGRGLRQVGETHDSIDTASELRALVGSGEARAVLGALRSPLEWDQFDLGNAQFGDLELAFGAILEVEAGGQQYRARASEHAGACGRDLPALTTTVREKFEREVGDGFDRVREVPESDLDEVAALL